MGARRPRNVVSGAAAAAVAVGTAVVVELAVPTAGGEDTDLGRWGNACRATCDCGLERAAVAGMNDGGAGAGRVFPVPALFATPPELTAGVLLFAPLPLVKEVVVLMLLRLRVGESAGPCWVGGWAGRAVWAVWAGWTGVWPRLWCLLSCSERA